MPWDYEVGRREDSGTVRLEGGLVVGVGVDLRCPVGVPPQVGEGHHPVIGLDEEGGVLVRVARGEDHRRVW